jgi:hypothetical protein
LSEENFSLQNYLQEKNRVPTPPPSSPLPIVDEQIVLKVDEDNIIEQNEEIIPIVPPRSPSPQIIEQPSIINNISASEQTESNQFGLPPSLISSVAPSQPEIRVELNEKQNSITSHTPRSRKERASTRQRNHSNSPAKTPLPDQLNKKRYINNHICFLLYSTLISAHHFYQTVHTCGIPMQNKPVQKILNIIFSFICIYFRNHRTKR